MNKYRWELLNQYCRIVLNPKRVLRLLDKCELSLDDNSIDYL